ncbi:MAG: S41 family peptidase [Bacteroidota bacterium]
MKSYFSLFILTVLCILFSENAYSQSCHCESQFDWLQSTFEENDAGFQYALDIKGKEKYQAHNNAILPRIKKASKEECVTLLREWLTFFRNGHLGISTKTNGENHVNGPTHEEIIAQFADWETYDFNEIEFKTYVSNLQEPSMEGIWSSPPYTVGVKKEGKEYVGFILEADGVYWRKGQVKFKLSQDGNATFYMRDHSAREFNDSGLVGSNFLQMGFISFERVNSKFKTNEAIARHYKSLEASGPFVELLSPGNVLIRIPSFNFQHKKAIDSVIAANYDLITSNENFIIDLRNNGGGSDSSYQELLPLLYTNPIRTVGVELLSTPLNNSRMEGFINNPNWSEEDKDWARKGLKKLNKRPGEFVNLRDDIVSEYTADAILPYPKNVAIIINENNGSTTEQFLLAAKQSTKTKLFGHTTTGVLDISNMHFVDFPCGNLQLGYALSRSMRIPHMAIDDKGIQPDYYVNETIPDHEWVSFVLNNLKNGG